ncbi:family 34 glycosyltransferase [Cryphonectria parasitica EP155]|uniref:Family 34 glycosyltransferase n=1 Tax=Cryphonectria parasitica (strain ATCC 38755 / EP155) TaxID=660469 RepID=A0A9P5CNU9_CRYP1|nr:family 34 glycosyltransferase [Cryphonectria parasitica EP155]KAF3765844.1 family 34 glycosyltransferase [Cryphonectria parasitica EP155]
MHLPYPARKDSNPAPFQPRSSSSRLQSVRRLALPRRYRQHAVAIAVFVLIALVWLVTRGSSSTPAAGGPLGLANHVPSGRPPAVIVTVLDERRFGSKYTELLKENRKLYAERHGRISPSSGYITFFPQVGDYDLKKSPSSWTKIVAMRHAMTKFPDASYLWYVDVDTFIMNPQISVDRDVMAPAKLEATMIVDHPVVPPDSIIHTFSHLGGGDVDLVLTQDKEGLVTSSFVLRNSEWSRYLLETWFDPIYRSYNFQKAETHALEHIVQWHPTILSRLALVPQRTINSYSKAGTGEEYQTGDLAVRFPKCAKSVQKTTCEAEAEPWAMVWRSAYRNR